MINKVKNKINSDIHLKELLKGSSIAFVLRIVGIIAGYVFTLLVTRTLGAESWGIVTLSLVTLQIASVIGRLGMDTALLRFTAEYVAKANINTLNYIYKRALTLVIPFSILISVLVYFVSPILANKVFHKPNLTEYFQIISLIVVPFVLLQIYSESIKGLKKIKEYMFLQIGNTTLAILIFLVGIVIFYKTVFLVFISYGMATIVSMFIAFILFKTYIKHLYKSAKSSNIDKNISYSYILSLSIPLLFSSSLSLMAGWTDTIMLGIFKTTEDVGIYNIAMKLSMITSMILASVNTVVAPRFAEFYGKKDFYSLKSLAQKSTKLIFFFSLPIFLFYILFADWCMSLFGSEFEKGSYALIILSLGQLINAITGSVGLILMMTGRQREHLNLILIMTLLNIILNVIMIPKYGLLGAALATALSMSMGNILGVFWVKKYYGFYTIKGIWR